MLQSGYQPRGVSIHPRQFVYEDDLLLILRLVDEILEQFKCIQPVGRCALHLEAMCCQRILPCLQLRGTRLIGNPAMLECELRVESPSYEECFTHTTPAINSHKLRIL